MHESHNDGLRCARFIIARCRMFEFKPFIQRRGFQEFYICGLDADFLVLYVY
jgi:hypothetical protein